jgi:ribosomal protein L11 methylase PrmA
MISQRSVSKLEADDEDEPETEDADVIVANVVALSTLTL